MYRYFILIIILISLATSCKSTKNANTTKKYSQTATNKPVGVSKLANTIVNNALKYKGVKYQYGGSSKKGMDCSGLINTACKEAQVTVPRTTSELSKTGYWIDVKEIQKGDLIFFATNKGSRKITHVGIVTSARKGAVDFIHASTSKGVIVSSLSEKYWYFAYVQARRIL